MVERYVKIECNGIKDSNIIEYHRYLACVAKILAAAAVAQSFSSYGGVGHLEVISSLLLRVLLISTGLVGVVYSFCPKLTPFRFADGEGVR